MKSLLAIILVASTFQTVAVEKVQPSYSADEMVFIQSVMYQPLAKFCNRENSDLSFQGDFKSWQKKNQTSITHGAEDFALTVEEGGQRVERVIKMLIHQVEADWGGSTVDNRSEKCQQLKQLFNS